MSEKFDDFEALDINLQRAVGEALTFGLRHSITVREAVNVGLSPKDGLEGYWIPADVWDEVRAAHGAIGAHAEAVLMGLRLEAIEAKVREPLQPSPLESSADAAGEWDVDARMAEAEGGNDD